MSVNNFEEAIKRIQALESEFVRLQEAHYGLATHYAEFVKASVIFARENSVEPRQSSKNSKDF